MPDNGSRFRLYKQHALGIIAESVWILALALFAFLMAVAAKAIWP